MVDADDIVKEFLVESLENLDQLDRDLMALEESPNDRARLQSVFRTIHTIKGTSGFLAFQKLEHLTHVGENLLVRLRDGALQLNSDIATALLEMVDAVRRIVSAIEATGAEGDEVDAELIDRLGRLHRGEPLAAATPQIEIPVADVIQELRSQPAELQPAPPASAKSSPPSIPLPDVEFFEPPVRDSASSNTTAVDAGQRPAWDCSDRAVGVAESTIRIDVNLLDDLMNLVGELVLARNQIMQFSQRLDDSSMTSACQRLNLIATELQEGVMKTRMQPIGNAWAKLPRVVRDLSLQCGKQVQVKMEGAETELDKTILESIKDPLTHIVRNAVDHGIESPAVRQQAGKPAEGTLHLRAFHEGGQVNIEISDDGAGIDLDRVRRKAIEKGLITRLQADAMGDRESMQLILLPGFSTAEKVTNVSGRGVGMDVVKTNIEKIGGVLDIQSTFGLGTVLRIKIPLTLAIVPALVVSCQGARYCIPQVSLLELVRLDGDAVGRQIDLLHSVPVYRLRGRLLPLVYLDEHLGLRAPRSQVERAAEEVANVVVLQAEDRQFGLVVDRIEDTQEIVVKPLGQHLKRLETYAGSTIMGDGGVSLILDVLGIAQHANVLVTEANRSVREMPSARQEASSKCESYLVVENSDGSRAAMRLSDVARLETIRTSSIETVSHQQVIQYRGEIMPLVTLGNGASDSAASDRTSVVVYNGPQSPVGVAVGRIVDIVSESDFEKSGSSDHRIICGRVTELVDLQRLAGPFASTVTART